MLNVVEPSEKWVKGAESLNNLAEVTERIKAKYADFGSQWGKDYKRETVIYTMGSGANYGAMYSLEICLFMEMQWIRSTCIHSGEYFHGPFEVQTLMYRLYLLRVLEQLENWMKELTISAASFHRSWQ